MKSGQHSRRQDTVSVQNARVGSRWARRRYILLPNNHIFGWDDLQLTFRAGYPYLDVNR